MQTPEGLVALRVQRLRPPSVVSGMNGILEQHDQKWQPLKHKIPPLRFAVVGMTR